VCSVWHTPGLEKRKVRPEPVIAIANPLQGAERMLRFRHASDCLLGASSSSLSELAATCGYYDQAHLDRDFRDFAQTTPTAYLAERVTFVQDASPAAS